MEEHLLLLQGIHPFIISFSLLIYVSPVVYDKDKPLDSTKALFS